ncbi:MAG: hypothetical protein AAFW60_01870 [Pseudomonadota bacterium]
MHTEDEAKKLWCPFARMAFQHGNTVKPGFAVNRIAATGEDTTFIPNGSFCIGSECAAWRAKKIFQDPIRTVEQKLKPDNVPDHFWERVSEPGKPPVVWGLKRQTGFCGLAGKP